MIIIHVDFRIPFVMRGTEEKERDDASFQDALGPEMRTEKNTKRRAIEIQEPSEERKKVDADRKRENRARDNELEPEEVERRKREVADKKKASRAALKNKLKPEEVERRKKEEASI